MIIINKDIICNKFEANFLYNYSAINSLFFRRKCVNIWRYSNTTVDRGGPQNHYYLVGKRETVRGMGDRKLRLLARQRSKSDIEIYNFISISIFFTLTDLLHFTYRV